MRRAAILLCVMFCIAISALTPAEAVTARQFVSTSGCKIDADAMDLMESLGQLTYLDSAFILRIAPLTAEKQRSYTLLLASDGHITVEKLKKVPLSIAVPKAPGDIIPILYEQLKEDYWRGWLNRHSFMAKVKMREWRDTADRRFVDPPLARELIDIFFQKLDGKYTTSEIKYLRH